MMLLWLAPMFMVHITFWFMFDISTTYHDFLECWWLIKWNDSNRKRERDREKKRTKFSWSISFIIPLNSLECFFSWFFEWKISSKWRKHLNDRESTSNILFFVLWTIKTKSNTFFFDSCIFGFCFGLFVRWLKEKENNMRFPVDPLHFWPFNKCETKRN